MRRTHIFGASLLAGALSSRFFEPQQSEPIVINVTPAMRDPNPLVAETAVQEAVERLPAVERPRAWERTQADLRAIKAAQDKRDRRASKRLAIAGRV